MRMQRMTLSRSSTAEIMMTGRCACEASDLSAAQLVARGRSNRQIAEELVISERTAEGHVERIREKLGVRNRAEVAVWVVQNGQA